MKKTPLRHPARLAGSSLLRLQSDERLAELAAAGHDAAFDAIVVRYRPALLKYCGAIVGAGRAEDAVQQTLLNAHTALGDADEVRHLRSWLYRIAHNVSLNLLRSVRDDVSLDADGAEGLPLPAAAGASESFEVSEQFHATVAALQALPERQRAALVLRELEGRSHEEIASTLGVSAGSARQHLMRARVAMRGAVTAVTPWGLIVRIADLASAGGGAPGGLETAAGAGLGAAGLTKLAATVAATGALVGGAAVGTHEVVGHDSAAPAQADIVRTTRSATPRRAARTTPGTTVSLAAPGTRTSRSGASEAEHRGRGRGRGSDDGASGDHHGRSGGHGRRGSDDGSSSHRSGRSPGSDDRGGDSHRGRGKDDGATEHAANSGSGSGSGRSGSRGGGHDDTTEHSGSGSGRSSGGSGSGGGESTSGSGSGKSGDDAVVVTPAPTPVPVPLTSESTDSSGGSSGSSGSGSDDSGSGSSGSGKSGDDSSGKSVDD